MGFAEEDVRTAVEKCKSVEAAVEFIMEKGASGTESPNGAAGAAAGAAAAVTEAVGQLGELLRPWKAWWGAGDEASAPEARGGAERELPQLTGAEKVPVVAGAPAPPPQQPQLVSSLLAIGFSQAQAEAAARRCSSVEAAVEWLAAQPENGVAL